MGTIDLSKAIGLSGKIGPVIAYVTKDGKQAFRSYTKPNNPQTPKQIAQRAKFALANKALSPLNKIIKRGHAGDKNAYRTLVGKAYHEAVKGEYPNYSFDYSNVRIASGKLPLPARIGLQLDPLTRTAVLDWEPQAAGASPAGSDDDSVRIVCFNTDRPQEVELRNGGTRSAGRAQVELPEGWKPGSTHFWVYLTSHDLKYSSDSVYLPHG